MPSLRQNETEDIPGLSMRRGVFTAPWHGPHGEPVLAAVTSHRALLCMIAVPAEADRDAVLGELWHLLDLVDPAVDVEPARPRLAVI